MHSIHSVLSTRLRQKRVSLALASFYVLASGCARDGDPAGESDSDDVASGMETPSTDGQTTADAPEVATGGAPALDAALAAIDAARKTNSSERTIADASAAGGRDEGTEGSGASSPTESADGVGTLRPAHALDGGTARDGKVPMQPQGDSGSMASQPLDPAVAACAAGLSSCVLKDPFRVDSCLDQFSMCEPVFSGDAGQTAACATRFATCVLRSPLAFDPCFAALTSCPREP